MDLVLERADGTIVGIEVKANATVEQRDLRGLLSAATKGKFRRGIVLYTGLQTVPFGSELWAVPRARATL